MLYFGNIIEGYKSPRNRDNVYYENIKVAKLLAQRNNKFFSSLMDIIFLINKMT